MSLRKRYTLAAFEEGNLGLGRAQVLYLDKNITDTLYTADKPAAAGGNPFRSTPRRTIYDIKAQRTLPLPLRRNQRLRPLELAGFDRPGRRDLRSRRLMARYARKVRDIFRPHRPCRPTSRPSKALETLHNQKLWQSGRHKQYYSGLTDILRTYLAGRYGFGAMEMTSDEPPSRQSAVTTCRRNASWTCRRSSGTPTWRNCQSPVRRTTNEDNYLNAYYFVEETKPAEIAEEGTEQDDTQ